MNKLSSIKNGEINQESQKATKEIEIYRGRFEKTTTRTTRRKKTRRMKRKQREEITEKSRGTRRSQAKGDDDGDGYDDDGDGS